MEQMIFGFIDDVEEMSYENDFMVLITTKETWEQEKRMDDSPGNYPEAYKVIRDLGFVDVMEGYFDAQRCKTEKEAKNILEANGFVHNQDFANTIFDWDEESREEEGYYDDFEWDDDKNEEDEDNE